METSSNEMGGLSCLDRDAPTPLGACALLAQRCTGESETRLSLTPKAAWILADFEPTGTTESERGQQSSSKSLQYPGEK